MHAVRRRKKRPNYGVRTVEVCRGKNGFGFTISGQQPCILSCIVAGSPAEKAGLRPGDYLVSVNGYNVGKVPHDDVVRLVGSSTGILKLQIAENYYSDSSDEDAVAAIRPRPKYLHKPRQHHRGMHHSRVAKVVRDLKSGAMFDETSSPSKINGILLAHRWVPPPPVRPSVRLQIEKHECQAVIGYLGTIEMPREIQIGTRPQIVRSCIRRLRTEKRSYSLVLFTVSRQSVILSDCHAVTLAEYPARRITFCGTGSDAEKKFFGMITIVNTDSVTSNSCHVFTVAVDCPDAPPSCEPIVAAVRTLYGAEELVLANSPQPSTTSSNSDSGIGFRDDCGGNQSDRILMVDIQNQRLHIQQVVKSCAYHLPEVSDQRLTVRAMPDPVVNASSTLAVSSRSRSPLSNTSSEEDKRHVYAMSVSSEDRLDKLSPKVYGVSRPIAHSLEDLKTEVNKSQQWGSLQELRSFEAPDLPDNSVTIGWDEEDSTFPCRTFSNRRLVRGSSTSSENNVLLLKGQQQSEQTGSASQDNGGRIASWAASLERLVEDPIGLQAFTEFLKKEFSHENIYFWVACEHYRLLDNEEDRKILAKEIFNKHLCLGALEPVNIDSRARQAAQEGLNAAMLDLFVPAQKQIFNLMKFDSYPRFLKSDIYKDCLVHDSSGEPLPFSGNEDFHKELGLATCSEKSDSSSSHAKLKKSRSDAEDRRRKSLLLWHRKSRSKSKDRGESEYCGEDTGGSHSSLASWDMALRGSFSKNSKEDGPALCRVMLSDGATTVVQIRPRETVRDMVIRLLDKRGLHYSSFEVFTANSTKAVNLDDDSNTLAKQEVRVDQRVVFRLDLPSRKTIGVKANPNKTLCEILRPILHKYNYKLELITLCLMSENEVVELDMEARSVDGKRLQVLTRNAEAWKSDTNQKCRSNATLDEITNRVFEELRQGKAVKLESDQGSEDWGSEHSSGIFGRFLHRDSSQPDKLRESRSKSKKGKQVYEDSEGKSVLSMSIKPPLIAKIKAGVRLQNRSESDELYEGLKRAQRSRLEDQRGTEINFELPDFLKDKENSSENGKKFRKPHPPDNTSFYVSGQSYPTVQSGYEYLSNVITDSGKSDIKDTTTQGLEGARLIRSVPSPRRIEDRFKGRVTPAPDKGRVTPAPDINYSALDSEASSLENDQTIIKTTSFPFANIEQTSGDSTSSQGRLSDPPPLPPKPKNLLAKPSAWNVSANFRVPADIPNISRFPRVAEKRDPKVCRTRRGAYLDQPSSSFV